jgi:hypothetical protein
LLLFGYELRVAGVRSLEIDIILLICGKLLSFICLVLHHAVFKVINQFLEINLVFILYSGLFPEYRNFFLSTLEVLALVSDAELFSFLSTDLVKLINLFLKFRCVVVISNLLTLEALNFIVFAVHLQLDLIDALVSQLRLSRLGYHRGDLGVRIMLINDFSHTSEG